MALLQLVGSTFSGREVGSRRVDIDLSLVLKQLLQILHFTDPRLQSSPVYNNSHKRIQI